MLPSLPPKFDAETAGTVFVVLLAVLVGGTATGPMPQTLSLGSSAGLVVFGLLTLFGGVKHGEYRASR